MSKPVSRRALLQSGAVAGAAFGLGNLGFLGSLPAVHADDAKLDPSVVRVDQGIEPLVRLLEETPRERLLEEIGSRIRNGLSYRDVLAALLLAGVKNVEPRPQVGFKFHAVLVVNSAHLASLSSPPEHRWLPIFWALDYFKVAQAADRKERDWTMKRVDESAVPAPHQARAAFMAAMDRWDEPAADAAVAGLARSAGVNEIYEILFRYGVRDLRSIGHKAIYVANSLRTLQCIGWQHAEPVLRSLAYAILMHEGENPATRDDETDRPYRRNVELAKKIRPEWRDGKLDRGATEGLLTSLRTATSDQACDQVVESLNRGVAPQSIWDALFVASGELLMRQPAIVGIHVVTTSNAVHFAFQSTGDDETRRLLLLQNAAYVPMFRKAMESRGKLAETTVSDLKPIEPQGAEQAVDEIFSVLKTNRGEAAGRALGLLKSGAPAKSIIDAARVLAFLKGNDAHDYKFSSAVLEDYDHISSEWRDAYLASNLFNLRSSKDADVALVQRTRAALGT